MLHLILILVACQKPADPQDTDPTGTPTPPDTDTLVVTDTAPTTDTMPTTSTGDTAPEVVTDCTAIPGSPITIRELDRPRGYHGLAFDPKGNLIGSDGDNLIKVAFDGTFSPWAVGLGMVQEMDWMPDGDLAVADTSNSALVRVNAAGAVSLISSIGGTIYGVRTGPDGKVWVSNEDTIYRVDPVAGTKDEPFLDTNQFSPQVVEFSPDNLKVYMGNHSNGEIFVADLDNNGDPIGNPTMFATGVGNGPYMDCMVVDECGNLYVCDYSVNNLYRISPTGQVGIYENWSLSEYGHGAVFGTTAGGWNERAIYQPQPYDGNTVVEIDIGARGRDAVAPP